MVNFIDFMMDDKTAVGSLDKLKHTLSSRGSGGNIFYRYKNMEYGQTCTLRFLPGSSEISENEVQPDFWLPKKIIRLRFENPEKHGSEVVLPIPAMQMYTKCKTEDDLVLRQAKELFDESDKLKKLGREEESKQVRAKASYHWHRGEGIAQCFVIRSPFLEQDPPENPIRPVEITKQIINVITSTLKSDDPETKLEYWPCHGKLGTNFVIKKTQSGEWPRYNEGSGFSRMGPTPLTTEQLDALAKYGLFDLTDFLPERPTDEEYQLLAEIVRLSIEGEKIWNPDWEDHFTTVKIFKTGMDDDNDLISQISRSDVVGRGSVSPDDVLTALRTSGRLETQEIEEAEIDEPEVISMTSVTPTKTAEQVRAVVNRIKSRDTKIASV